MQKIKVENLIKEVTVNKLTDLEIAVKYNCSYITIGNLRRSLNLKCNKKRRISFKIPTKEELQKLYSIYGTDSKVANFLNVNTYRIKDLRVKYQIQIDNYGVGAPIELSHEQKEILFGILLGDGYCKKLQNQKRPAFLIDHSFKQKEYVDYISTFFKNVPGRLYEHITGINKKTGKRYKCYCFYMNENAAFDFFRDNFYINNKKEIPIDLLEEYYTPRALAFHYMDDGTFNGHTINIATCNFSVEQINLLRAFLLKKYNIDTSITKDKRIYIKVSSHNTFLKLITPYICESMIYKLVS